MKIRCAQKKDIPQLKPFLNLPCDWDEVDPNLIVIDNNGTIQGSMILMLGKPVGMIEMILIDQTLPKKTRFKYYIALAEFGRKYLLKHGAKVIMAFVPFAETSARRILYKYFNCKPLHDCKQIYYIEATS